MFEVLAHLYQNWFDCESCPDPDTLMLKFKVAGFEDEEIEDAMDWLGSMAESDLSVLPESFAEHQTFRAYHPSETLQLSTACRGYLAFLETRGVIDPIERELIIAHALSLPQGAPDLDQLRMVVLIVLWAQGTELDPLVVEELLPDVGDRVIQ
jgi:Smg protein